MFPFLILNKNRDKWTQNVEMCLNSWKTKFPEISIFGAYFPDPKLQKFIKEKRIERIPTLITKEGKKIVGDVEIITYLNWYFPMSFNIQQSERSVKRGQTRQIGSNSERGGPNSERGGPNSERGGPNSERIQNMIQDKVGDFVSKDEADRYSTKKQAIRKKYPKISTGIPTDQSSLEDILDNEDANVVEGGTIDAETSELLMLSGINNAFNTGNSSINRRPLRH